MLRKLLNFTAIFLVVAVTAAVGISTATAADSSNSDSKGLITIIVNDPSNPYWKTEGQAAAAEAKKLGYTPHVVAHGGDTNKERNEVDTAIANHAVAVILDPANAEGSIGSVKKLKQAGIPVFIVNAEIDQQGLAKAQLVSNNAQGAALGAQQWVKIVGDKGNYAELKGPASDNNAATRSNGYHTVLSQFPNLKRVAVQVADWDRTKGHNKMQGILQAHPNIIGVISGNDEMALGAIAALKQAGKLDQVTVGGFDGSPAAIDAIKKGELAYTVLQPVAVFARKAVDEADHYLKHGNTGVDHEKQLFNCILITKDMVNDFVAPFTLKSMVSDN